MLRRTNNTTILRDPGFTASVKLSSIRFGLFCAMNCRLGHRAGLASLLATSLSLACISLPGLRTPDPFGIPRQAFFDSVKTIVVTTTSVVGETNVADSILTQVETLIEERLQEAGLSVVPASAYAEIWHGIANEAGGFFDPYTGMRDEDKFKAATERLRNEIVERFSPNAILYPEIWEDETPFSVGVASWGGVTQRVTGAGGYSGDVIAATLLVTIQGLSGNELYSKEAGIQVLEYMQQDQFVRLSQEQLFSDSTWIPAAVTRALDPLAQGRPVVPPES